LTDQPAATPLDFGEDLVLLRWALPPLGLLMAIAGAHGWKIGRLQPLADGVLAVLGIAAAISALRVSTRRIVFDAATRVIRRRCTRCIEAVGFERSRRRTTRSSRISSPSDHA
jgi:hypothetical protein